MGSTGTRSANVSMVTPQCTPSLTHWVDMQSFTWIRTRVLYMMSSATSGFQVLFCTRLPEVLTCGTGTRLPVHIAIYLFYLCVCLFPITVNFAYNDTRRGIRKVSLFVKCRYPRSLIICITVGWDFALGMEFCRYSRIVVISKVDCAVLCCLCTAFLAALCLDRGMKLAVEVCNTVLFPRLPVSTGVCVWGGGGAQIISLQPPPPKKK